MMSKNKNLPECLSQSIFMLRMPATTPNLHPYGPRGPHAREGARPLVRAAPFKEWRGWPSFARLYGVRLAGMGFISVYGPREESKKQYANMVSQFLWQMREGGQPLIYGDREKTRAFIHVYGVVRVLRMAKPSDYRGVFNVGMGRACNFNEVIGMINSRLETGIKTKNI
jgi:hypothetical protein